MRAFALAGRLLTVIPWPGAPAEPEPGDMAAAVARFPLVGLVIGFVLVVLNLLLWNAFPSAVRHAALVVALAALTGGFHLDGLSDLADALGGGKSPEERLRIMKDSRCGPMGALAIACTLLLKFAALESMGGGETWRALLLAPVLGRAAMACLVVSLPYARPEGGTGKAFAEAAGTNEGWAAAGWALVICLLLGFFKGIIVALLVALVTLGVRRLFQEKIGGGTGDGYGAGCEVAETAALLLFASW